MVVGDIICPELARRRGCDGSAPFTERSEFVDALRRRPGEPARDRGPLEGLRDGALAWEEERRAGIGRGVVGLPESGDLGVGDKVGDGLPLFAIDRWFRELVRSSSPAVVMFVCEARRSGCGASDADAIFGS